MIFNLRKFISKVIFVSIISSLIKLDLSIFWGLFLCLFVIWFRLWIKIISCQLLRFFYFLLIYSLFYYFFGFHHFIFNSFFFWFLNFLNADLLLLNLPTWLFLSGVKLACLRWIWRSEILSINWRIQLLWLNRNHFRNSSF